MSFSKTNQTEDNLMTDVAKRWVLHIGSLKKKNNICPWKKGTHCIVGPANVIDHKMLTE